MYFIGRILENYPLKPNKTTLISDKGKKAVWSIIAGQDDFILKKMAVDEERLKFMIHAINHLRANGIHTPEIKQTANKEDYVRFNKDLFVLFEAIHGKKPTYKKNKELHQIVTSFTKLLQVLKFQNI
ncbi:hypothetical protein ACFFHM_17570 [Halalkalibacter kiskunsagensis]|uniref:Uncharacterized protein n=1 Tax=Halalkalibacter kiskunsagensis TaxID=1548599 RepID=A0ABV6KG05_9BACI